MADGRPARKWRGCWHANRVHGVVSRVRDLTAVKMNLPVLISGDRKSSLGVGIELLSALKAVGVEKASFQVKGE